MAEEPVVHIIDDDDAVRDAIGKVLDSVALSHLDHRSAEAFLETYDETVPGCLIVDVRLEGMSGLDLHQALLNRGFHVPVVVISGHGDIPMAVEAVRSGAVNFIEKPFRNQILLEAIVEALETDRSRRQKQKENKQRMDRFASLTDREREVCGLLIQGLASKKIAGELSLSPRTVESHRASIMQKVGAKNSMELTRLLVELGHE